MSFVLVPVVLDFLVVLVVLVLVLVPFLLLVLTYSLFI